MRADGQRRVVSVGVVVSFMIGNRHRIRAGDVCGSRALLPRLVFVVSDCHAILAFTARSSVLTSGCVDPEIGKAEIAPCRVPAGCGV